MKIRFVTPADRDVSGAPEGGALYFDARIGLSANPGTAARPKRYLSEVPATITGGGVYYFRNGGHYGGNSVPTYYSTGSLLSLTTNGTEEAPTRLVGWGDGDHAIFTGAVRISGWGEVSDNHENAWLEANGEQLDGLPGWANMWCGHYIGEDMLQPAVWSPVCPVDLGSISRFDAFAYIEGSDTYYQPPAANSQLQGDADSEVPIARDMVKAELEESFTFATTITSNVRKTTLWARHPAIAEHYGDTAGPVGAWFAYNSSPSNGNSAAVITEYDYERSEIKAELGIYGGTKWNGPNSPRSSWRILGHPFDLRQPGQYAVLADGNGTQTAWRARGEWNRGASWIAAHSTILKIDKAGEWYTLENIHVARAAGFDKASLELNPANSVPANVECRGLWMDKGNAKLRNVWGRQMNTIDSQACPFFGTLATVDADGFGVEWCFSGSASRRLASAGILKNVTFDSLGRTGYLSHSGAGVLTIEDLVSIRSVSAHGNVVSFYNASQNHHVNGAFFGDSRRPLTSQTSGTAPVKPRNMSFKNLLALDVMALDETGTVEGSSGYDSHSFFDSSEIDRWCFPESWPVFSGGADLNGNGLVRRSFLSKVAATGNMAGGVGEDPTEFRDILTNTTAAAYITGMGGTPTRVVASQQGAWTGSLTEEAWETMSREVGDHTSHEAFALSAQRFDWQIPAYNAVTPTPGTPVDLRLSTTEFFAKTKGNTPISHVLRARPMSILSLPAGVGDNDLFELRKGRIVPKARLTAVSYSIAVDETPQAKLGGVWSPQPGAARRTKFTLMGRR